MTDLRDVGIDMADVVQVLEDEGVEKFETAGTSCSARVEAQPGGRPVSAESRRADRPGGRPGALGEARRPARRRPGRLPASPARDATLWGPDAEAEASKSGSAGSTCTGRAGALLPVLADARERSCAPTGSTASCCAGMGGSSLAPEVITATAGVPLDRARHHRPAGVRAALGDRLDRTVVVVLQQVRRHRRDRQPAAGLRAGVHATPASTPRAGIVVVTDPGSPFEQLAARRGLPRRRPRRPRRGRPLQRADRVRARAERPRRRRRRRAARRRPRRSPTGWPRTPRTTRRCARRRAGR